MEYDLEVIKKSYLFKDHKDLDILDKVAYYLYAEDNILVYYIHKFIERKSEYQKYYQQANIILRKEKLKKLNRKWYHIF